MGIPDLIRRVRDEEPPPNDLLNGPHTLCHCGKDGCNDPMPKNPDRGPGR